MSGLRLFKDKILDKFDTLADRWKTFSNKITRANQDIALRFSTFSLKFEEMIDTLQPESSTQSEILKGLKTKNLIQGDVSYQHIEEFTKTLWESHDLAQEAFQVTNDLQYHEMAMETLLVIKEMELLKEYLGRKGQI